MRTAALALVLILLMAGCSTSSPASQDLDGTTFRCEDDLAAIVELMRSGIPTFDYEPADGLQQLIDWSDLIVVGTVDGVVREPGGEDDTDWTVLSSADLAVVGGTLGGESPTNISYSTRWADGQGDDPLADRVATSGLSVIAFLVEAPDAPGGFTPLPEGLQIACGQEADLVTPVIADLPIVPPGATIEELIAFV